MPPKKEEKPVVPVGPVGDSSKFCYIVLSSKPVVPKIRVGTDCQTDFAVNWIRQQLIISLGSVISSTDVQEDRDSLTELKTLLTDTNVETIEFTDEVGTPVNIQLNLKNTASTVLKGRLNYKICLINEDKTLRIL